MALTDFLIQYKNVLLFYLVVVVLLYLNRHRFEIQAKFIALYRTKIGIKLMQKIADTFPRTIRILGYIGIPIGYIGMALILYVIGDGIFKMVSTPDAPPVVSPVLPGLPVPGTGLEVPFFQGMIALFLVIVIHEFSHGVVAKAHKIKIKTTGFVMFGPIPGAFVDPDEEKVKKSSKWTQLSIFAAGPWSNIITAAIVALLFLFVVDPLLAANFQPNGFEFPSVVPNGPASIAEVPTNTMFTHLDDTFINSSVAFITYMENKKPGDSVLIKNDKASYEVITGNHPNNESKAYLGVQIAPTFSNQEKPYFAGILWLVGLLNWFFIFSIGLGLANLMPLGPVDGGRMFHTASLAVFGEKKGNKVWLQVSIILLVVLVFLLFQPLFKHLIPF